MTPQSSSPAKKRKKGSSSAVVVSRLSVLITVLLTAIITRQATLTSVLMACDGIHGGGDNAGGPDPSFRSDKAADRERVRSGDGVDNKKSKSKSGHRGNGNNDDDDDPYAFDAIPSRTWKVFEHDFPCYPPPPEDRLMSQNPCREGILFQRPEKVGSTTMTNVVLRLAFNRGAEAAAAAAAAADDDDEEEERKWKRRPAWCQHRSNHGSASRLGYAERDPGRSFLFGLVRDPIRRMISMYFHFSVTFLREEPTDDNFVRYAIKPNASNSLLRDMTFDPTLSERMTSEFEVYLDRRDRPPVGPKIRPAVKKHLVARNHGERPVNATEVVAGILDRFDFIAVTERMDESLVALKLLLGLSVEEILYARASRSAGSFSNGLKDRPCMYLIPPFLTGPMKGFFRDPDRNDVWMAYSSGDALLHRAASASLDRTIDEVFGREFFERELSEFRNAAAYASAICSSEPGLVAGMCDEGGNPVPHADRTCYIWSEGCDHVCLNERVPHPVPPEVLNGTTLTASFG